ncbi:MAG TPA: hypothetical protein PKZ54_11130 [Syntrophorhabdaceae bacterium]|nr:hypothetical protein [Syntrophorhabdaceae bacterium]
MKKKIILSSIMFIFLFCSIIYGAETVKNKKDSLDAKEVFEKKCSACHNLNRTTSTQKTPDEWKTAVWRMKSKKNANITDEEAEAITDYLSKTYGKKR